MGGEYIQDAIFRQKVAPEECHGEMQGSNRGLDIYQSKQPKQFTILTCLFP